MFEVRAIIIKTDIVHHIVTMCAVFSTSPCGVTVHLELVDLVVDHVVDLGVKTSGNALLGSELVDG